MGSRKLTPIAKNIGVKIETQIVIDQWLEQEPEIAKEILKMATAKKDLGYDNKRAGVINKMLDTGHDNLWTQSKRINIGVRLVDLISSELGIIEVKRRFQKNAKLTPKGDDFDADGDSGSEDDPETGGEPALSVFASAAPDLPSVTTL